MLVTLEWNGCFAYFAMEATVQKYIQSSDHSQFLDMLEQSSRGTQKRLVDTGIDKSSLVPRPIFLA